METLICIDHSTDRIAGDFPQVQHFAQDQRPEISHPISNIWQFHFKPIPDVLFPGLCFSPSANPTDVVSASFTAIICGLIVSNRLLSDILEKHILPSYQRIPVSIDQKGKLHHYNYLHFIENTNDLIDFSKTKFYKYDPLTHERSYLDITSHDDYIQQSSGLGLAQIKSVEIIFKPNSYDLLSCIYSPMGIIITDRLFRELKRHKITGFSQISDVFAWRQ